MEDQFDPTDLVGQEAEKADQSRLRKNKRDSEIKDFQWLMGDARGRRFMWRMLEMAGVYRSSFTGNSTTFFNEGQRNIGLMLVAEIHDTTPDAYALMLKENRQNGRPASD